MFCFISICIIIKIVLKLIKSKDEDEIQRLLKELPFYNEPIENQKLKNLTM